MRINFDMDGTIANLYGFNNWLECLQNEEITPYKEAKPLINMNVLARYLNRLHNKGFEIAVITWGAKFATEEYNNNVQIAKEKWLKKHLKTVQFDEIIFLPYGTPKEEYKKNECDILFDDEELNRINWKDNAFDEKNILEILKNLLTIA